jgi:hypothetical protein
MYALEKHLAIPQYKSVLASKRQAENLELEETDQKRAFHSAMAESKRVKL